MASKLLILVILGGMAIKAQSFDFFYFVQQWPGSYCDTSKACCYPTTGKPAANFSIHGLWPNNNDGTYPSNCGGSSFDVSQLADLQSSLDTDWGSLACPSSNGDKFWSHEWSKHGTCSGLAIHDYFLAAITLYSQYDLTGALSSAGITGDGNQYDVANIQSALQSVLGQSPGIECNTDQNGNAQLYQIYVCVSSDGSSVIACPVLPNNECSGSVTFPSF